MELVAKVKKVEFELKDSRYSNDPEIKGEIELNNKVYNIYPRLAYQGYKKDDESLVATSATVFEGSSIYTWDLRIQELDAKSIEALGISINFDEVYPELNRIKAELDAAVKLAREEKARLIYEAHPIVVYFKDNPKFKLFGDTNPDAVNDEKYNGSDLRVRIGYEKGKYRVECNNYEIKDRRVSTPEKAVEKADQLMAEMKEKVDYKIRLEKAKRDRTHQLITDAKEVFGVDIYQKYDEFYFRGKGNGTESNYEEDSEGKWSTIYKDKAFKISKWNEDWVINGLCLSEAKAKKVMQVLLDENS